MFSEQGVVVPRCSGQHSHHIEPLPLLGVQTPSLFCVTSWGLFRQFQAILGNLLGPFSGDFRQFRAIFGNFGQFFGDLGRQSPRKKPVLINKKKAGDCTPNLSGTRCIFFDPAPNPAPQDAPPNAPPWPKKTLFRWQQAVAYYSAK